jgi:hypothetical protein
LPSLSRFLLEKQDSESFRPSASLLVVFWQTKRLSDTKGPIYADGLIS